jgi:hypothetical protein
MVHRVVVRCKTGGWVFWFPTWKDANNYAKAIIQSGLRAKVERHK